MGYNLETVPYSAWRKALMAQVMSSDGNVLAPVLSSFPERQTTPPTPERAGAGFSDIPTRRALAKIGIDPPNMDKQLYQRWLKWFKEIRFLP